MYLAFSLPLEVVNPSIWQVPLGSRFIPPFPLKQVYKYKQLLYQQSQNNYISLQLWQLKK